MNLIRNILLVLFAPSIVFADCSTALTVTNDSKYPIEVRVNGIPVAVLEPGQSINDKPYLSAGQNAVKVKPVTKKGEISTSVKGPKDTKFSPSCADGSTSTIIYENNHFVKISTGGGHGPSTPAKPKAVGNAGGRKLSLSGRWYGLDSKGCTMDIQDGDDIGKDDQLAATLVCNSFSGYFEGSKIGAKIAFFGIGAALGGNYLFGLEGGVFSDIVLEYEGDKIPLDAIVGTFYSSPKAYGGKVKFVRPN